MGLNIGQGFNGFRASMSAAPLKRAWVVMVGGVVYPLPRFYERGPIEAPRCTFHALNAGGFRASMSAAPLKRVGLGLLIEILTRLPRFYERGPIEAAFDNVVTKAIMLGFRASMSAAPLKQKSKHLG